MSVAVLLVAAGRGSRAGGDIPKQFQRLDNVPILARTLATFAAHPRVAEIVLVHNPADRPRIDTILAQVPGHPVVILAEGGATRDGSVRAGLAALSAATDRVLIHDGARPLVTAVLIDRVLDTLRDQPAAAPALPVTDALWTGAEGKVTGTRDRTGLWRAQTPQGFHLAAIRAAHAAWPTGRPAADDVEIALTHGIDVRIVEGDEDNIKITHPPDFARAAMILRARNGEDDNGHTAGQRL